MREGKTGDVPDMRQLACKSAFFTGMVETEVIPVVAKAKHAIDSNLGPGGHADASNFITKIPLYLLNRVCVSVSADLLEPPAMYDEDRGRRRRKVNRDEEAVKWLTESIAIHVGFNRC